MGCTPSKHSFTKGSKESSGIEEIRVISWPAKCQHIAASYPTALCAECTLPSHELLVSLGTAASDLPFCTCNSETPKSPSSPQSPKQVLPTCYNFNFGFDQNTNGSFQDLIDNVDDDLVDPASTFRRYASFSAEKWQLDQHVVFTTTEVSGSRSNSTASSCGTDQKDSIITCDDDYDDDEPFVAKSTLEDESFGPRLRIWSKMPFETLPSPKETPRPGSAKSSKSYLKAIKLGHSKLNELI